MPFVGIWAVVMTPVFMIFGIFFILKNTSDFSSPAPQAVEMNLDSAQKLVAMVSKKYNRELYRATDSDRALYNTASALLEKERRAKAPTVTTFATTPSVFEKGDAAMARAARSISRASQEFITGLKRLIQWVLGLLIAAVLFMLLSSGGVKKEEAATVSTRSHAPATEGKGDGGHGHGPANPFNFHPDDWRRGMSTGDAVLASLPVVGWLFSNLHAERKHAAHFLHHDIMKLEIDMNHSDSLKRNRDAREGATKAMREIASIVATSGKDNFPFSQDHLMHVSHQLGAMKGMLKADLEEEEGKDDGSKKVKDGLRKSIGRIERFKKQVLEPVAHRRRQQDSSF